MPYKHKGDTLLIRNAECVMRNSELQPNDANYEENKI